MISVASRRHFDFDFLDATATVRFGLIPPTPESSDQIRLNGANFWTLKLIMLTVEKKEHRIQSSHCHFTLRIFDVFFWHF